MSPLGIFEIQTSCQRTKPTPFVCRHLVRTARHHQASRRAQSDRVHQFRYRPNTTRDRVSRLAAPRCDHFARAIWQQNPGATGEFFSLRNCRASASPAKLAGFKWQPTSVSYAKHFKYEEENYGQGLNKRSAAQSPHSRRQLCDSWPYYRQMSGLGGGEHRRISLRLSTR